MRHEIHVETYDGNRRPYQARVYENGVFIGKTGFCATRDRATRLAEKLIMKRLSHR